MYKISLNTIELVKRFCELVNQVKGDVIIESERYVINGKSIMGLFSLDLSKPLIMILELDNEEDKERLLNELYAENIIKGDD